MKTLKVVLLIAGLIAGTHAASAQIQQGSSEVSLFGALTQVDPSAGSSTTTTMVQLKYGYFFTDQLSVSAEWMGVFTDDADVHLAGLGADYFFPMETVTPYVGASGRVYAVSNGSSDSEFLPEVRAGLKQFISENTAIDYRVSYMFHSDFNILTGSVGISFFFN